MAILRVSNELLEQPEIMPVLMDYFDEIKELMSDNATYKRFAVKKEGLPNDDTYVDCRMKRIGDKITVDKCYSI